MPRGNLDYTRMRANDCKAPTTTALLPARGGIVEVILEHLGIVAEEEICLKQYGDTYRAYLKHVPRYLLFF